MNQGIFRLIADQRRGMTVAVGENARGRGKGDGLPGRGTTGAGRPALAAIAASLAAVGALSAPSAWAVRGLPTSATLAPRFNLPQAAPNFNQSGRATQQINPSNGRQLDVEQLDKRVILNWSSFDIGAGHRVRFNQPAGGSALNRIGGTDPSVILGALDANAEVILYNANGVLFGAGATVNTGNFIATTLNIADSQFEKGFRNITSATPAFAGADGEIEGFVRVEAGASLNAGPGGDVMLLAPRVLNEGRITAPGGQVVLAAGQKVYLAASTDPAARGFMVEVDPFATTDRALNTVENAARGVTPVTLDGEGLVQRVNEIVAERGSVNLVGLAVKQNGTARATTAVQGQNGAIYLLAHGRTTTTAHANGLDGQTMAVASELGELVLGPDSVTRVDPEASSKTQLDAEPFYNSVVRLEGKTVHLQGGARIVAPGAGGVAPGAGNAEDKRGVSILASATPRASGVFGTAPSADDGSRIVVDPGASIDVAGTSVDLPMSRNVITGRLFSIQLADMPLQRQGVLYRAAVSFDARKGTAVADVRDFYNQVGRTAAERLAVGGSVRLAADGAVVVGQDARIDVSGGRLNFAGGELRTTLLRQGDRLVDISAARPDVVYDEVITPERGRFEPGYVEGRNAGEVSVTGRQVVLDGRLDGRVSAGRFQRGGAAGARPLAGRLQVGSPLGAAGATDYYARTLELSQDGGTPLAGGFFADPFAASLGPRGDRVSLSARSLAAGGLGRVVLNANDVLSVAPGTALDLGVGGEFVASARRIDLAGRLDAPSGTISLNAVPTVETGSLPGPGADLSVRVASGARLNTAGTWTNDARGGAEGAPVATAGGTIRVAAFDGVNIAAGAALDASAGAWRDAAGRVRTGKAGSVDLAANSGNGNALRQEATVVLDGTLTAFGFDGGGTVKVSALDLAVGSGPVSGLRFSPAFFSDFGFESITLSALRGLNVQDDTVVRARLRNRALDARSAAVPTGTPLAAITHFAGEDEVSALKRRPVNLVLSATRLPSASEGRAGADLRVGRGAVLATEAGGALALNAGGSLSVAGTLSAPGGSIALTVDGTRGGSSSDPGRIGFLPAQALWLTGTARLDAAGTAKVQTAADGRRSGTVYGGGTVTLNARHGYLVAESGAQIDLDGYETTLHLGGERVARPVSRDAGKLVLGSPEGIFFDATVSAQAPGPRAAGGTLEVSVSREGREDFTEGTAYPAGERQIVLRRQGGVLPAGLVPGDDLGTALGNGTAVVSAEAIQAAGFDAVKLRADDRIGFAGDVVLAAGRSVVLDTRVVSAQGNAAVEIAAPYVALGDASILPVPGMTAPAASAGSGSLAVRAGLIDVVGTSALQGFATTRLEATRGDRRDGEIRLRGRAQPNATALAGALRFAGRLDLTAAQVVPTTLSEFTVQGLAGNSVLATHAPAGGSTAVAPLSAFGRLTLTADTIAHGGTIRAPFGQVTLDAADRLTLGDDSTVSVSGAGVTVPVGSTVNGASWNYRPHGAGSLLVSSFDALPVDKQVTLDGGRLEIAPTAAVSAAGGGAVVAPEWVAGAGGSTDYLAGKGLYAVLPGYAFDYAPHDAQIAATSDVKPGEQFVVTLPGSALAPGRYTLLPAAYGVLPGAVIVSKSAVQGVSPRAEAQLLTDGSALVTAYRTTAGTAMQGDAQERWRVEPAPTFRAKAEYRVVGAGDFLDRRAARFGTAPGARPADAGRISLAAGELAAWKAHFDLSAPAGARAGEFDLAAPDLVLVREGQAPSTGQGAADGFTVVDVDRLAATGAGSVLLGGQRRGAGERVDVTTVSGQVRIEADVAADELLAVGRQAVAVADGVTVVAAGTGDAATTQINLAGDGALLRVSNRSGASIVRTGATRAGGDLAVGAGTTLAGAQVDLDATGRLALDGTARVDAASFSLGAGRIAFAGASPEGDAVTIAGPLLQTLDAANRVALRSYSTIDFLAGVDLSLAGAGSRLTLDTPGLRGLGASGDTVRLAATEVLLRNTSGGSVTANGRGTLLVEATPPLRDSQTGGLEVGEGALVAGFDRTTLQSTGDVVFSARGSLTAQGDLDLVAARVTAKGGADQAASAGGKLGVRQAADGRTLGERVGVAARLALSGRTVEQAGTIDLPGGQLSVAAGNPAGEARAVVFAAGSTTRAGGFASTAPDGWAVFGDGGQVKVSAAQGAIVLDGSIDVAAAAGGGHAGRLEVSATGTGGALELGAGGRLAGRGGTGGDGGTFSADVAALAAGDAGGIDRMATAAADFTQGFELRVRSGDLRLDGATVKAENVGIAADGGRLTLTGTVDARAPQGGLVRLAARDDLTLGQGGQVFAASGRAGANGGDVLLASKAGTVRVLSGSTVDAGGDDARDGRVVLRAQRAAASVSVAPLAGAITAGEIDIEAVRTYTGFTSLRAGTTSGAALGQSAIAVDLTGFMGNKAAILSTLGVASDPRVHLRPGVDIEAAGDFTVSADWNLYSAVRAGGEPGFLTVRAAGNLNLNGTISDGHNGVVRTSALQAGDAWSYRLAAGADLAAANPLATVASATRGDLTLAGGKLLRTSSGSIDLAAGRDVVLGGTTAAPATVLVTGTASALAPADAANFIVPSGAVFAARGGRIGVAAVRDVRSPATDQALFNNWFYRSGRLLPNSNSFADSTYLAWWSKTDAFRHGFGSFGGGNVAVSAGRDLVNVTAVAPTMARMASPTPDASKLLVENGGNVVASAGRDIAGGAFFVGRGEGRLSAGNAITAGSDAGGGVGALAPTLGVIDGDWRLRAAGDLALTAAFNPTITQSARGNVVSSYYTYAPDAALDLASAGGNVNWASATIPQLSALARLPATATEKLLASGSLTTTAFSAFYVAPPRVAIAAHGGNVVLAGNSGATGVSLYPAASGKLSVFAGSNIELRSSLRVMDNKPETLAGINAPAASVTNPGFLGLIGGGTYDINKLVFGDLHAADSDPVRVHAGGSIGVTDGVLLVVPKAATISAGGDISGLGFIGQNHREDDVTRISAGGSFVNRTIVPTRGLIALGGPGALEVRAGRQVDLGASAGIETTGRLYNATLPEAGAAVRVAAGLTPTLDATGFANFTARYLGAGGAPSGADYRTRLADYVRTTLGQPASVAYSDAQALDRLNGMSERAKIAFVREVLDAEFGRRYLAAGGAYAVDWTSAAAAAGVPADRFAGPAFARMRDRVLFAELQRAGIAGAAASGRTAKDAGYAPGYEAIELSGLGAPFRFFGDIDLIESKVQTKSGGDIELRAPGGGVNVGLSADISTAVGGAKSSDKRGVVAYDGGNVRAFTDGDFQVNAQKVFVIGKGDIMLWSSNGNIDSGRGSNNTVTVPPLVPKIADDGSVSFQLPTLATGSGIGILDASDGAASGAAYLFAPRGEVIALDAFIRAPTIFFDPEKIRGADNAIGVSANPVAAAPSFSVAGLSAVPTTTAEPTAAGSAAPKVEEKEKSAMLTVEVVALGEAPAAGSGDAKGNDGKPSGDEECKRGKDCPN